MGTSYYIDETVFSAGGVLVDTVNKKVYLIYKEKSEEWLLPKGHIEPNETIEDAAKREIYEETGYENQIKNLLSIQIRPDMVDPSKTKIIFWFLSQLKSNSKDLNTQKDNENFTGKWLSQNEATLKLKWGEDKILLEKCFKLLTA